jgi:xylulokinase
VRHNIETIAAAGGDIRRVVAVGGGTQGALWTQIVSDITGRPQVIPSQTIGASYGGAFLAAQTVRDVSIDRWNPVKEIRVPRPEFAADYDELYGLYRELYTGTKAVAHALTARQMRPLPGTRPTANDEPRNDEPRNDEPRNDEPRNEGVAS